MFPVQKSIYGSLAAFVLILTTYICTTSFPVASNKIEQRVDLGPPKPMAVNTVAPVRPRKEPANKFHIVRFVEAAAAT